MKRYDGYFRLAHELKKNLNDVLGWGGVLTHRQFIAWQCWLNAQLNVPTRDNFYQMQIACEVRRTFTKNPNKINPNQFKLEFGKKNTSSQDIDSDEFKRQVADMKQRLLGFMTKEVTVIRDGKVAEIIEPPLVKRQRILREQAEKRKKIGQDKQQPEQPKELKAVRRIQRKK